MRLRNIPGAEEALANSKYVIKQPETYRGKFKEQIFQNENPIHIEIGMGKGKFLLAMAQKNPDINYIGIELYSSVLLRAVQKMEELEKENNVPGNVRFLCVDARKLGEIFAAEEIDRIYLNFSDPWPKARHASRRLTSREFLARYDKILKEDGTIEFKTDNRGLFDFSLEEVAEAGWKLEAHTFDLHHDEEMMAGNVMTEYEEKFSSMGNPICKMIISR